MEFHVGQKLGKLTLLKYIGHDKHSKRRWLCLCDCGNTCERVEGNLIRTKVPHCGCSPAWVGTNKRFEDLSGKVFGKLTVVRHVGKDRHSHNRWLCQCECGNMTVVDTSCLVQGKTKSCGCAKIVEKQDGRTGTRLYNIYNEMKYRCYGQYSTNYRHYGGRGITMCDEWKNDFITFKDWALSHGYNDSLTIDRIDVNGNYCPENCRWATMLEQSNNKRNTIKMTYGGVTKPLSIWAKEFGLSYMTVYHKYRKGLPPEEILKS